MTLNEQSEQKKDQQTMSSELTSILSNTFDYVGMEFIDTLLREITLQTKVQSTLLLQLLSAEEYNELSSIYKKDNFHVLQSSSSSPEIVSSPVHQDSTANQFLLIRSCYIDQPSMNSR